MVGITRSKVISFFLFLVQWLHLKAGHPTAVTHVQALSSCIDRKFQRTCQGLSIERMLPGLQQFSTLLYTAPFSSIAIFVRNFYRSELMSVHVYLRHLHTSIHVWCKGCCTECRRLLGHAELSCAGRSFVQDSGRKKI